MARVYLPKIKMKTAYDLAKKMVATSSGKKINPDAFKKFLRKDENLKKFTYVPPQSSITKQKAKEFLGKITSRLSQEKEKQFKLSYFAKKDLKIRTDPHGRITPTSVNKIYKTAVSEELKQAKPSGPSPEEIEKQERRKEAFQILRKREVVDERRKEESAEKKGETETKSASSSKPVQIQGGTAVSAVSASAAPSGLNDKIGREKITKQKSISFSMVAVLPFNNLSQMENLNWIAKKISVVAIRVVSNFKSLKLIHQQEIERTLSEQTRFMKEKIISPEMAKEIQNQLKTDYLITGNLQKINNQLQVTVFLFGKENTEPTKIVEIKGQEADIFALEKQLSWHLSNQLEGSLKIIKGGRPKVIEPEIPSASEAKDMPI